MTATVQVARDVHGGATVHVEGTFDQSDAEKLVRARVELHADGPVTVDFHDATVEYEALVRLATGFTGAPGLLLIGLCEHHHRLLRYFGLDRRDERRLDDD